MTEPDPTSRLAGWRRLPARIWQTLRHAARTLANACQGGHRWYQAHSPRQRHLLIGVMLGIVIDLLLHIAHPRLTGLQEIEDMAIDEIMRLQATTTATLTRPATPFVVLDIDEDTYHTWGEPFHLPRDRLLKLIDYAVQHEAALVIVDVDLSQRGHDPAADQALQDYLAAYGSGHRPPLLLVRAFRVPPPERRALPTERRSFLEDTAAIADSPLIHWGSTLFELDQGQRLRRWRLWQITCDASSHPPGQVVPSLQLLATAFLSRLPADPSPVAQQVNAALQPLAPEHCERHSHHDEHGTTLHIADMTLSAQPEGIAQRIVYELPWRLRPGEAYPTVPGTAAPPLLLRSALPITDGQQAVAGDFIKGRVVVIGGSFWESRDLYLTPLGQMPGFLVLVNAICCQQIELSGFVAHELSAFGIRWPSVLKALDWPP